MAKNYHHGNLRAELLSEAGTMLESQGEAELSLREVGRKLGVSPAAPYRHFQDKDALLVALIYQGFDELNAKFESALTLGERLGAYSEFFRSKPNLLRLMFGHSVANEKDGMEYSVRANKALASLLGAIEPVLPSDANYREKYSAALATWSLIHGYSSLVSQSAMGTLFGQVLPSGSGLEHILRGGIPEYIQQSRMLSEIKKSPDSLGESEEVQMD